jgi:hydroxymethylbilane synthase
VIEAGRLRLRACIAQVDGSGMLEAELTGKPEEAESLGRRAADQLRAGGADKIIAALQGQA